MLKTRKETHAGSFLCYERLCYRFVVPVHLYCIHNCLILGRQPSMIYSAGGSSVSCSSGGQLTRTPQVCLVLRRRLGDGQVTRQGGRLFNDLSSIRPSPFYVDLSSYGVKEAQGTLQDVGPDTGNLGCYLEFWAESTYMRRRCSNIDLKLQESSTEVERFLRRPPGKNA